MARIEPDAKRPGPVVEKADHISLFATQHRSLILSSPLWLAAITIVLNYFGDGHIRSVVQFLTASPLR